MIAKRFFYVSAGILCLALAYHFGAKSAVAQSGSSLAGFAVAPTSPPSLMVMTSTGDVYAGPWGLTSPPILMGNFWSGAPTPAAQQSWGQVKARYR